MKLRDLGRTGLKVTELGFGGGAIGGLYAPVVREQAMGALQAAWDAGIRYFDTAPFYGHGLSERRVGDFLQDKSGYVISTKVGKLLEPVKKDQVPDYGFIDPLPFNVVSDYSHDAILRSVDSSFQRLGVNKIDIVYVHALERASLGAAYDDHMDCFLHSGLKALERLRREGTIVGFGLGVNEVEPCLRVMDEARLDCLLLANRYTLLDRRAAPELMPRCLEQGTGVVIGGVFNSGILATGAIPGSRFDYAEAPSDILEKVNNLDRAARAQGGVLAEAAIKFALSHPSVASVLIGTAKGTSLNRNVALFERHTLWNWSAFDQFAITAPPPGG